MYTPSNKSQKDLLSQQYSTQSITVYRGVSFGVVLVVEVQRHNAVLLAEGPPPPEPREAVEAEARIALSPQLLHVAEYRVEGFLGAAIIRADADVAAELEHGLLLRLIQARLLQHHHPLGLAEDVVVERALGYAVLARGLGEAHLLRDHRLDRLLQLLPRPRRRLHLHHRRVVS